MQTRLPRAPWLSWLAAGSSLLLLLLYVTWGVHMRLGLGRWPTPIFDDYNSAWFTIHEVLMLVAAVWALFLALPTYVACCTLRRWGAATRRYLPQQASMYALGWLLVAATLRWDPTSFTAWFKD